jgi:hypothetical protein
MNEEPDLTEVVEAVERLRRNYRRPLPGNDSHPEPSPPTDKPGEGVLEKGTGN